MKIHIAGLPAWAQPENKRKAAKTGVYTVFVAPGIPEIRLRSKTQPVAHFPIVARGRGKFPGVDIDAVHKGRRK